MNDDDTALTPTRPRGGRPKGALNRVTKDAAYLARAIITDPDYLATLFERAMSGTLGPMEPVLWAYGFGRPKEDVVLPSEGRALSEMSDAELLAKLDHLKRQLMGSDDAIDVSPVPTAAMPEPSLSPTYRQPETDAKHTAIDAVSEAANEKQTRSSDSPPSETVANVVANASSPAPAPTAPPLAQPPLEHCRYCHRSLVDCADMRATNPARFEMVHHDSPEIEAKRRAARDAEATAEMMQQVGKPIPW